MEIIKTYFWGWIIFPILIFGPLSIAVREVSEFLGIDTDKNGFSFYTFIIIVAIAYLIVIIWILKDLDDKRGLPHNYKELIKNKT